MDDLQHDSDLIGLDLGPEADPELLELHRELEGLEISERPSFGPELLAELEGTWRSEAVLPMRRRRWPRVAAAMAAGLVIAFASVPSARAAFLRFVAAAAPPPADVTELPPAPEDRFLAVPELQPVADGGLSGPPLDTRTPAVPDLVLPDEGVRFVPAPVSYAELRDRRASQATVRSFYPAGLQEAGVAGVVTLELWVDETGVVSDARLATSSGVPGLDQAAIAAAPFLRFYPAVDRGRPVGTWVRFDLEFTGLPEGALAFPDVEDPEEPDLIDLGGPDLLLASPWAPGPTVLPDPFPLDGAELLAEALGSESVEDVSGLGSASGILAGVPPEGVSVLRWRESAARALEAAIVQQPQNPAPYLALGRLRVHQGLPGEAEDLFAEGILRVDAARRAIPPGVVGDLHYERALIDQAHWRATAYSGRIPVRALRDERCEGVTPVRGEAGFATAAELISRNVLCPDELGSIRERAFRPAGVGLSPETWIGDLEAAVEAFPGHLAAGTELVLGLLDHREWEEAEDRARTVETASGGAPVMTLLRGVAAHRAGRTAEAANLMDRGLSGLAAEDRSALESPEVFLGDADAALFAAMSPAERSTFSQRYWAERDPRISSPENERRVEHLARTTYASLRFESMQADGARAWVLFGRPDTRWAVGTGAAPRTEFWDYGPGPDLMFRRSAERMDHRLDEASRAVIESAMEAGDGGSYAPAAVTPLPGQATVLRESSGMALEFRAALDLGPLLGSEPATVRVACYLVSESGEVVPVSGFTRYGAREALDLAEELPAEATGTVVVEVERGPDRVGTFRFQITEPPATGGARASSMTLLAPEPGLDLDGSGSFKSLQGMPTDWRIHHDTDRLPAGPVGLYLELYDLPTGLSGENRFELVLRAPTSGEAWSVPVLRTNVSDQVALDGEWSAEYLGAARQPAFAVLSLPEVVPGDYDLVLTVSGPGFDESLVRSRSIRVR